MNFEQIASVFPKEEKYWPCLNPAKALPLAIRSYIKEKFGGIFSANDLFKKNSPSRLGVTTRPFEIGDPIATISKPHFIKTNELLTKIDFSPGRQKVIVIFHNYINMTYSSEKSKINKGQLANGILAIIEESHKGLSHFIKVLPVNSVDLFNGCKQYQRELQNAEYVYFITDLLYIYDNHLAAAKNVIELLNNLKVKKGIFLLSRDPLETNNININIEELIPWKKDINFKNNIHFSGDEYFKNIDNQIMFLRNEIKQNKHLVKVLTSEDNIEIFINFLIHEVFGKK
ncbi:hypothetical protein QEJ31_13800 [Pigmentibacter sp. JX0631]|uniref:hypothetical protein n=1 Tax=Pigmentibacter sp. JX0631 TaxID=2976982 RepID=UPI002468C041|nr:hypothetical protein [Pigmentibacter sp. JX0631]WGL59600.1 hypothetical protein QEJ31_13800 [Pigmentibacter sp. JX0631]